ncbi:hypothetical protein NMD75_08935 [Edwardsiella tarda]
MIIQSVIDGLSRFYSVFDIKFLTVIATGFTIYFGYQKVNKKICVSHFISEGVLYPAHISNLVLSNKRDNTIAIRAIKLKIGSKGTVKLVEFNKPLILKAYDTQLIELKRYSCLHGEYGEVNIELTDALTFTVIANGGKKIKCNTESSGLASLDDLKDMITVHVSKFNNIVLTSRMSYIFFYHDGDAKHVIFDRNGFIPDNTPFGINKFPDMTIDQFRDFLINSGFNDRVSNYLLAKISDNLEAEIVLTKYMVEQFIADKKTAS